MASLPQLGIYSENHGNHVAPMNLGMMGSIISTNPLTTTRQQDIGPIFPTMSCNHTVRSPVNTLESLAAFRQHIDESHHDLANLLTQ